MLKDGYFAAKDGSNEKKLRHIERLALGKGPASKAEDKLRSIKAAICYKPSAAKFPGRAFASTQTTSGHVIFIILCMSSKHR